MEPQDIKELPNNRWQVEFSKTKIAVVYAPNVEAAIKKAKRILNIEQKNKRDKQE